MDAVQLWGMVAGLLLSFVLGLLMKKSWAQWLKFLIVIIVSAIVGVIDLLIANQLEWNVGVLTLIGSIVAASQVTFWFFINQVPGLKDWLYAQLPFRDKPTQ